MTYAQQRRIIDVDSHLIELDDFLRNAARSTDLPLLQNMDEQQVLPVVHERLRSGKENFHKRQNDPAVMTDYEENILDNSVSGWSRLGAFDPQERSRAVDLFGYELQWVLPTFSFHQVAHTDKPEELEAGARTLNRAMGQFCAHDDRLKAVGYLPLTLGPTKALALMNQGFEDGCYTFMVDTNEPDDDKPSFTHPNFDPVWARYCEANIPFGIHVAANGHYKAVPNSFKNNGRTQIELGGDAPPGELGIMTINNSAELFCSALIFDGVFERHPKLRGICMEHGAFWVPSWLKALDFATAAFSNRREFKEMPSVTAKKHLKFSPFAGEPVGWIIENIGTEMLVYASDYPHPEGSGDPIKRFEATMRDCDQAAMDAFYYGNMLQLMDLP